MFRILKNVVRVNSTEKEILLGVEFTFTLCAFFQFFDFWNFPLFSIAYLNVGTVIGICLNVGQIWQLFTYYYRIRTRIKTILQKLNSNIQIFVQYKTQEETRFYDGYSFFKHRTI